MSGPPTRPSLHSSPPAASRLRHAAFAAIAFGAAIRVIVYAKGNSLWQDELLLALNIGRRDFLALAHPLAHDQMAPLLYLWTLRLLTAIGGVNEYVLRLPALLAGILLPFAIWRVGRRIAGEQAAVVASFLAALSPTLVAFSNQVKPYSSDALIAVLIAGMAWQVATEADRPRTWVLFTLSSVVGFLSSFPALFTIVACLVFLSVDPRVRSAGWKLPLLSVGAIAISVGAIYLLLVKPSMGNAYLQDFWRDSFLRPAGVSLGEQVFGAVREIMRPLPLPAVLVRPRILLPLLAAGVAALWYGRGFAAATLCGAGLLAALSASAAGRYPVATRLFLFATPFILLMLGNLVALALRRVESRAAGVTALAGFLLPLLMLNANVGRLVRTHGPTEGRGAVHTITQAGSPEPVYIAPAAAATWSFYSTDWRRPDTAYLDFVAKNTTSGGKAFFSGPSRHAAVNADESRDLTRHRNGHVELLGARTGMPFTLGVDLKAQSPDSGWAEGEVDRMMATCSARVWIVSTLRVNVEAPPLLRVLSSRGARVLSRYDELAASALHVELPTPALGCQPPEVTPSLDL